MLADDLLDPAPLLVLPRVLADHRIAQLLDNPTVDQDAVYNERSDQWSVPLGARGFLFYAVVRDPAAVIVLRLVSFRVGPGPGLDCTENLSVARVIMVRMADDLGERLVSLYIAARGYTVLECHVDLGTPKRPDFLIQAGEHEVVVEVKTFDPPTVPHNARHSGFVRRNLGPVRSRIGAGAKQLRGIAGRPLVVLLTSPLDPFIPLSPMDIMEAMYGDLHVAFTDGGLDAYLGRNAKLRIEEPDGTAHGDHPHLSAVAVLRCAPAAERRIVIWLRDHVSQYRTDLHAFTDALHHAEQHANDEDVVYLDVFETVSTAAHPLPRTLFCGPLDGRWGETAPGRYGALVSSRAVPITSA